MRMDVFIVFVIMMILSSCVKNDETYKEPVRTRVRSIQEAVNKGDLTLFSSCIDSLDVIRFYKLYSLYTSFFKSPVTDHAPVMELIPFKMGRNGDVIKVQVLLKYNGKIQAETNTNSRINDVLKKVIDLGLPNEIFFYFRENAEKQYKLVKLVSNPASCKLLIILESTSCLGLIKTKANAPCFKTLNISLQISTDGTSISHFLFMKEMP